MTSRKAKPVPLNCRPASRVSITLTVGQEKIIRKSIVFGLMGNDIGKTVRHFVRAAVIAEAIGQTKNG